MRSLTLHEKITIKAILSSRMRNCALPRLTMANAIYYWHQLLGYYPIRKAHIGLVRRR